VRKAALIMFFRWPGKGKVKTRLAAALGSDITLALYHCFLRDIVSACRQADADRIIAATGSPGATREDIAPGTHRLIGQRGKDLGERMCNAFADTFRAGYDRAVLIGSDCPDITPEELNEALRLLDDTGLVLGPTRDGGYRLIGLRRDSLDPALFRGVPWSTPSVLKETLDRAGSARTGFFLLTEREDIDTVEDLKRFYERNMQTNMNLDTMRFLRLNEGVLYGRV
jgi:hypothetical protein